MDVLVHEGGIDDPTVLAAAVLHDTLKDTQTTIDELSDAFGVCRHGSCVACACALGVDTLRVAVDVLELLQGERLGPLPSDDLSAHL